MMGDAAPKINLYNLGSLGVNRVLSPIHKKDGEFLYAQNAAAGILQGRDAIKKRWGVTVYNATLFPSSVIAIHNLPYGGFADPTTGTTGSSGSTASWAGWVVPIATWERNGPGYWDGVTFNWASEGTWVEPPWTTVVMSNADMNSNGYYYATVEGYYVLGVTAGSVMEFDPYTPAYTVKSAPPSDPTTSVPPDSGNGWRTVTNQGDPDYIVQSWYGRLGGVELHQWHYTYKISGNAWTQVGSEAVWGSGSTYPQQNSPIDAAVVFDGRVYVIREQKKQSNSLGKYVYTVESAAADSTGSWTVHLTWDGDVTYQSSLSLMTDGNYLFVYGRVGGSSGGGAPYTYVNKRSTDGSSWADSPSSPTSTYMVVRNVDKMRTNPAIFVQGDYDAGLGLYPMFYSTDASSSWSTVSGTDTPWNLGGVGSASPHIWRAGDKYYVSADVGAFNFVVFESSAADLASLNWSTTTYLGSELAFTSSPWLFKVISLTPRTIF